MKFIKVNVLKSIFKDIVDARDKFKQKINVDTNKSENNLQNYETFI